MDDNQHLLISLFVAIEKKAEVKDGRLLIALPDIAKIFKNAGLRFEDLELKLEGVE